MCYNFYFRPIIFFPIAPTTTTSPTLPHVSTFGASCIVAVSGDALAVATDFSPSPAFLSFSRPTIHHSLPLPCRRQRLIAAGQASASFPRRRRLLCDQNLCAWTTQRRHLFHSSPGTSFAPRLCSIAVDGPSSLPASHRSTKVGLPFPIPIDVELIHSSQTLSLSFARQIIQPLPTSFLAGCKNS